MQSETTYAAKDGILEIKRLIITVAKHIICLILGFFMASAKGQLSPSPFGLSLVAGLPVNYSCFAAAGCFVGYLFVPQGDAFGYVAATISVFVVRMILSKQRSVSSSPVWSAAISGISCAVVGIIATAGSFVPNGLYAILGAAISAVGAFSIRIFTTKQNYKTGLSTNQLALSALALNILLTGLFSVNVVSLSIGRIVAILLILLVGRFAKSGGGAIFGISSAAVSVLCQGSFLSAFYLGLVGLISAIVNTYGKLIQGLTAVAVASLFVIGTAADKETVAFVAETVLACAIFWLLPKEATVFISKAVTPPANITNLEGLRKSLIMRLDYSSKALFSVSQTVDEVSKALSLNTKPDFSAVLGRVENDACKGCSFCINCWEHNKKETVDAILAMSDAIKKNSPIELADVGDNFAERCLRRERFENALYRHYTEYLSLLSAESRIKEMREIVSDQFKGISVMLSELSKEFEHYQQYDVKTADRIALALKNLSLEIADCGVVLDSENRMNVEIKLSKIPDFAINRSKILYLLNDICEREFEPPEIRRQGRECYITLVEKAVFTVEAHITQIACKGGKYCGDTAKYFTDGRGRFIMLLSDGMGSGGAAAVDSAMTAALTEKLLYSGFGYDCLLKIVNSAMLYKSSDESLSTVDITTIDLFSGRTGLYKAGAAPTIVRRSGRTGKAECRSLPIGILREVGFDKASISLKDGDIVLMMSDGVCSEGSEWICEIVENFTGGRAKELAEQIASSAARRRSDGHEDDITVMAAVIEKSV